MVVLEEEAHRSRSHPGHPPITSNRARPESQKVLKPPSAPEVSLFTLHNQHLVLLAFKNNPTLNSHSFMLLTMQLPTLTTALAALILGSVPIIAVPISLTANDALSLTPEGLTERAFSHGPIDLRDDDKKHHHKDHSGPGPKGASDIATRDDTDEDKKHHHNEHKGGKDGKGDTDVSEKRDEDEDEKKHHHKGHEGGKETGEVKKRDDDSDDEKHHHKGHKGGKETGEVNKRDDDADDKKHHHKEHKGGKVETRDDDDADKKHHHKEHKGGEGDEDVETRDEDKKHHHEGHKGGKPGSA
jgi:hypothetical protein